MTKFPRTLAMHLKSSVTEREITIIIILANPIHIHLLPFSRMWKNCIALIKLVSSKHQLHYK
jgi:hypothetical protein